MKNDINASSNNQVIDNDRKEILLIEGRYYILLVHFIKKLLSQYDSNKIIMIKNQIITLKNKDSIIYAVLPDHLALNNGFTLLFNRKNTLFAALASKKVDEVKISMGAKNVYIDCYKDAEKVTEITIDKLEDSEEETVLIPQLENEKTTLHITGKMAFDLVNKKERLRSDHYLIYIDKKTFEIMAIGACNKSGDSCLYELFNDDLVNKDNTREFDTIKVDKLFPLKKNEGVTICIYKNGSVIHVKTTTFGSFELICICTTKLQGFAPTLPSLTSTKLKENHIKETWSSKIDLNKFKFTVHTEEKEFLDELLMLIQQLDIVEKSHNTKIKLYGFILEKGKIAQASTINTNDERIFDLQNTHEFFTLKITNGYDYTFSFENLASSIEYDTKDKYYIDTINEKIILARINTLKLILSFIKSKGLYSSSKIKSIAFETSFQDKKDFDMIKLIKFNTGVNKDLYESFDYKNKQDVYTNDIYYKAYIPSYKEIIHSFQKNNTDNLSLNKKFDQLNDTEIREILEIEISKAFKHSIKITIGKEADGLYFAKAISDGTVNISEPVKITKDFELGFIAQPDTQSGKTVYRARIGDHVVIIKKELEYVKSAAGLNDETIRKVLKRIIRKKIKHPVEISIEKDESDVYYVQAISDGTIVIDQPVSIAKGIKIDFAVHMDSKSNFYKISHVIGKNICKESNKKNYCKTKSQLKYSYEVNGWDTKDSEILKKHNVQKYSFTLNDDLNDIVNNITTFTSRYKLLAIPHKKLIEELSYSDSISFKTVKKFDDAIKIYSEVGDFIKINNRNLNSVLSDVLYK